MIARRFNEHSSAQCQARATMIRRLSWHIVLLAVLGIPPFGIAWTQGGIRGQNLNVR